MSKKPFLKRTNRGVWVSAALLIAVAVYSVVVICQTIPQKQEIRSISETVLTMTRQMLLSDPDADQPTADEQRRELESLFVSGSDHVEEAWKTLRALDETWTERKMADGKAGCRLTALSEPTIAYQKYSFQDDVASVVIRYTFGAEGSFPDYNSGATTDKAEFTFALEAVCRQEEGQWRFYRWNRLDLNYGPYYGPYSY